MKATVQSTEIYAVMDGIECRLWEAVSEKGTKFLMFVHRVGVREGEDSSEMDEDLKVKPMPAKAIKFMGPAEDGFSIRFKTTRKVEIEVPAHGAEAAVATILREHPQLNQDAWEIKDKWMLDSGRVVWDCYRVSSAASDN